MKKTSIVHIQLLPILSGVQKSMIDFITRLDRDKYDITVICQCQGQLVDVLRKHQIKVLFIPELRRQINPYYDLIAFIKLYRLFKTQKYDVVHTHSSKPGFLGRLAAKTAKTKAIVHTVQGFAFHEFSSRISTVVFTFLEKIAALVSDIIISVNEYDRRIAIERRIVKRDKIITIPNGICLEEFTINIDVEDKKRQLGIAPNKKVVGMVARLWAQKAPQVFIKAAAYVLERRKDVVFLLVGDGELKSELELLVGELGIEKDVLFTGWRTDVPQILEILDIFLLTSLWEGLPITILEAMVKRKPVVATNIKGNRELIVNHQTGLLAPPKEPEAIGDCIISLLENERLAQEIGENGYALIKAKYDINKIVKLIESVYLKILSRKH